MRKFVVLGAGLLMLAALTNPVVSQEIGIAQGSMAGEVSETSVILQTRLTGGMAGGDVLGAKGIARFEIATNESFKSPKWTKWIRAVADHDFIVKTKVDGLTKGTRYYYRPVFGADTSAVTVGGIGTFTTIDSTDGGPISLAIISCMSYAKFHYGSHSKYSNLPAYTGKDKDLGYPALAAIRRLKPTFFIGTGDNVYYDHPAKPAAHTLVQMRKKWHEQFVQPRFLSLFAQVPVYVEKDDHDFRYDDADRTGDRPPSPELGIKVFREQMPVVDPADPNAVTYRTYRLNKHLQIWLMEGRDYRSPNAMPDGPEKTIWGAKQMAWFKRTLLASDATFKLLISPTPMIGPDDNRKGDNHTSAKGFRHERDAIFAWLTKEGFLDKNFYIICGDRHWQYLSVDPSGFEEFSTGTLVEANSRFGRKPGDPASTDPEGKIHQIYMSAKPTGGFLMVTVAESEKGGEVVAGFSSYDEKGNLQHYEKKIAR